MGKSPQSMTVLFKGSWIETAITRGLNFHHTREEPLTDLQVFLSEYTQTQGSFERIQSFVYEGDEWDSKPLVSLFLTRGPYNSW